MAKNWAISIGINKYEFLQPLNYAVRDARLMQEFFYKEAGFEKVFFFSDDSPEIDGKSTRPYRAKLRLILRQLFEQPFMGNGDNFWFFFSGHGMRHEGRDYLMPSDGDPGDIENTAIPISYVTERLRRCGADNVILILDACRKSGTRSGEGIGNQTADIARQTGVISIFSCSPNEYSYEIEALQQGAFTYALLLGLGIQGKCATVERLNQYLNYQVPEIVRQHINARQTPYTIAEPIIKSHLILIPQYATLADIDTLKIDAYRVQTDNDLKLAEQLWIRVLAAASGQDMEAIKALQKIALRLESLNAPSLSNFEHQGNVQPNAANYKWSYTPQEGEASNINIFKLNSETSPQVRLQSIDNSASNWLKKIIVGFLGFIIIATIGTYAITSYHSLITVFINLVIIGLLATIALPSFLNQANKGKQSEAKQYISSINKAQQIFYLEESRFASTIEELGLGINLETKNYIYNISVSEKTRTIATATAKEDGLKSYTGAVFLVKNAEGYDTTITAICETKRPSKTPPATPELVGSNIQCVPDSSNP